MKPIKRRDFLAATVAGIGGLRALGTNALPRASAAGADVAYELPGVATTLSPDMLARDESHWRDIAEFYDRTTGIVNLEHGYWGKMARPVLSAYEHATAMVNAQNSFYGRKEYSGDWMRAIGAVARALGVEEDEITLTRNATEAIHNLVRQYKDLEPGDAVLYADIDYPAFKRVMAWLGEHRGVDVVKIDLPDRCTQDEIYDRYQAAFDQHPRLKLMLVTHVSNQHGLVVPVRRIADEARRRGIDVICDSAQSWGLLDYRIEDLGVDWAGFNLHKWIGSPVGVGALYMRRGTLDKIAPYPGEGSSEDRIETRIHMGTANFAAMKVVPDAVAFHSAVGGANKEARLRYLRSLWTTEALSMPHIEVLGGADEASWTGMGAFRLRGRGTPEDAQTLQRVLERDHGIFTVVRKGLASGHCVRITPQVFTSADEVGLLVDALKSMAT